MNTMAQKRWKAAVDILVLISIFIGLLQSLVTNSDRPAVVTLAAVGLAWALSTGVSYGLDLLGYGKDEKGVGARTCNNDLSV